MNDETDKECIDLCAAHGDAKKMECLAAYSDERYKDTHSPWELSGSYRIRYADGADVVIGAIFSYSLTQGNFWFISDSTGKVDGMFARDNRVLAYIAHCGDALKREVPGECHLDTEEDARDYLRKLEVPEEPLAWGCKTAQENAKKWLANWQMRGMIQFDEEDKSWRITH